jgi:deoxyribodipyrimidine photo-lyase
MTNLVLLNSCLRLDDNPLLSQARGPAIALVIVDQQSYFGRQYGLPRSNLLRLRTLLQTIHQLQQQLAQRQIGLIIRFGATNTILRQLTAQFAVTKLLATEPTAPKEYQALHHLPPTLQVQLIDCNSLLAQQLRPDLATLADRFTSFRKKLEPTLLVAPAEPENTTAADWLAPAAATVFSQDDILAQWLGHQWMQCSQANCWDEASANARLQYFIWQEQHVLHYKDSRNALDGNNYASFFSTPLSLGTLSVRRCWQQISQFEQEVAANESTYWLKFELLWREFFRWQMRKYQARWFSRNGISGAADFTAPLTDSRQQQRFIRWCSGETGVPFIDANMQLLNRTGLMSNRGRQNVASYLIYDLGLDWRLGAAYFEQRLLDYDVASNWGNWAYIAGVGNSEARPFNPIKQALWYDSNADFVRRQLPDITVSGKAAHRPSAQARLLPQWRSWLDEL